jgi:hypothetical protein
MGSELKSYSYFYSNSFVFFFAYLPFRAEKLKPKELEHTEPPKEGKP